MRTATRNRSFVPVAVTAAEGAVWALWANPARRELVVAQEAPAGFLLLGAPRLALSVVERRAAEAVAASGFSLIEADPLSERMIAARRRES